MMEEPEENRLDQSLRDKFEDFSLEPSAPVWAGIEQRIGAPAPAPKRPQRPLPLPLLFGLVALLSGLAGWLLPHGPGREERVATTAPALSRVGVAAAPATQQLPRRIHEANATAATASKHVRPVQPALGAAPSLLAGTVTAVATTRFGAARGRGYSTSSTLAAQPHTRRSVLTAAIPGALATARQLMTQPVAIARRDSAASRETTVARATAAAAASVATADSMPATLRPLAALERQVLVQLPSTATLQPGTPPAGSRAALLLSLRAERAELLRLQRRTDSTLLALGDLPGAPKADVAAASPAPADTARPRPLTHRWSLLLTATPEQNTLGLQGPEGDSLTALRRNHETGRAGLSAALLAEYRLTPRLSVGGGVGFSTFGADLRITTKNTEVLVKYDTTTTRTTTFFTSTNRTYSVRIIQIPQLNPVFNPSGQVISYDTVYVPRQDTVFTTTVQRDSTHAVRRTITPLISKKETLSSKLLQPNYRFFTVPVLLRYRLTPGTGRWWADVSAGAQLQFFLGGTQVVTDDGETFRSETIRAGEGPFRRLNVALSGSLALNYALTNRLSVSVAPSLRWQALSLYKPETGLRQQPTATGLMFGVRFGL
ncbi:hypothetical protein JAO73_00575 [Hymenobacter sp. BT523]|uniref:hypothetical protein n=1 Tax=Hymenobacter sp. BT523 TaxID=2795725 RepID=UPI0018EBF20A|nr:hypothetical protein [Hymenobacter sp. BT523]MBJ6107486.1 hypothetical protein [Hymenobacter sp. BT523]